MANNNTEKKKTPRIENERNANNNEGEIEQTGNGNNVSHRK